MGWLGCHTSGMAAYSSEAVNGKSTASSGVTTPEDLELLFAGRSAAAKRAIQNDMSAWTVPCTVTPICLLDCTSASLWGTGVMPAPPTRNDFSVATL